jgi:hypothetical protein
MLRAVMASEIPGAPECLVASRILRRPVHIASRSAIPNFGDSDSRTIVAIVFVFRTWVLDCGACSGLFLGCPGAASAHRPGAAFLPRAARSSGLQLSAIPPRAAWRDEVQHGRQHNGEQRQ